MSESGNVTERELLPCPFCGSSNVSASLSEHPHFYTVSCRDCQADGPWTRYDSPVSCEERWNTRANERLQSEDVSKRIRALVDKQAEDEGLWFIAATASEAYLQQELRKLHAVIEDDKLFDGKTYRASDEYIKGWEDSRAFSAKMERAAKEIDAPDDDRYTEGYQDAVREMRDGWINADERLPDSPGFYLTAQEGLVGQSYYQPKWQGQQDPWWHGGAQPTHWRPLPEPPNHTADASKKVCDE